jgi:hypothetical protein
LQGLKIFDRVCAIIVLFLLIHKENFMRYVQRRMVRMINGVGACEDGATVKCLLWTESEDCLQVKAANEIYDTKTCSNLY